MFVIWIVGWKCLTIAMISVATAMLCKEQGITVTGVCAIYEIFVVQRVSFLFNTYELYLTLFQFQCFKPNKYRLLILDSNKRHCTFDTLFI